jgi:cytochrome c oxidase cbb3-type subunit 4
METYTFLRAFADSWFLIAMVLFYLGACLLPFMPSRRDSITEASEIPFRNETLPETGQSMSENQ